MPMVEKDGKKVPAFAADGKGKMAAGGMAKAMAGWWRNDVQDEGWWGCYVQDGPL
jgi:hypothetical protein